MTGSSGGLDDEDGAPGRQRRRPSAPVVLGAAWLAGAVPFSNIAARLKAGVDLREIGSGTVSGSSLGKVAGFGPLAVAGVCDLAKGAVGPLLAGRDRPGLATASTAAALAGHNWSPLLGGAGGRGISVAMGSLAVRNWPGTVVLASGLAIGRIVRHTGLGSFIADLALVPVLAATRGKHGARTGAVVVALLFAKRLAGNHMPDRPTWRHWVERLVFDRDPVDRSVSRQTGGATTGRHL